MGAIGGEYIDGESGDARHGLFVGFDFAGQEAVGVALFVPGWMVVVAEDEFGADARDFTCGLRRLRVAQIAEELHGPFEALGGDRIAGPRLRVPAHRESGSARREYKYSSKKVLESPLSIVLDVWN